jgi:hypothetical protein
LNNSDTRRQQDVRDAEKKGFRNLAAILSQNRHSEAEPFFLETDIHPTL